MHGDLEKVSQLLKGVGWEGNDAELAALLRRFDDVDVVLEAQRFIQTWSGGDLRGLRPVESWMSKAYSTPLRPNKGRPTGKLAADEIERKVAHYRQNISSGEVFGESYLLDYHEKGYDGPSEVDRLCDEYRTKLEKRK